MTGPSRQLAIGAATLLEAGIAVLPVTAAHGGIATAAWLRFGKGRHPAALNVGVRLSYPAAVVAERPRLAVGDGFPLTSCLLA